MLNNWLQRFSTRIQTQNRLRQHGKSRRIGTRRDVPGDIFRFSELLEARLMLAADYGDAPDTGAGTAVGNYQTVVGDSGPSHNIDSTSTTLFLGAGVDGDSGTLQNARANADDVDSALPDDEDGVLYPQQDLLGTIGAQPTITLLVTNTTGSDAILSGWIDYNQDGVFDNVTERARATVSTGTTDGRVTLTFPSIPIGSFGQTYTRFRLSTDSAADNATGPATDGEVEDHRFQIYRPITVPNPDFVLDYEKLGDGAGGIPMGTLSNGERFGAAVISLGDIDGDGVPDLAASSSNDHNGDAGEGAVFILFMNADGTVKSQVKISDGLGGLAGGTLGVSDGFGLSLAALGDLDGDGIGDLAVGALLSTTGTYRGAVYVLLLNADGTVKSQQKISDGAGGVPADTFDDLDGFGHSISNLGDLDGDGVVDLAVGAFNDENGDASEGAVYILMLNSNGTVKSYQKVSDGLGGLSSGILSAGDKFGESVATVGDLNGDGIVDLAVGAPNAENNHLNEGAVFVLFLNADGTVMSEQKISDGLGGMQASTLDQFDDFGSSLGAAGDLDGDGVHDLLVGARSDDNGDAIEGAFYVLLLNADGTVKQQQKVSDGLGLNPA